MSEPSIPETVVMNEQRENTPPRPARSGSGWQAPAVIALFLVIALIAAGVGIAIGSGADDEPVDTAAPANGICRTYDGVALAAPTNDSPAVPCTGPHSAQTFMVSATALPEPTAAGAWTKEQMSDASDAPCGPTTAAAALGITTEQLAISRLTVAYFMPTAEQARAGARWIRCDLALQADGSELATVSGDLTQLAKIDGAFAQCVAVSGQSRRLTRCKDDANTYAVIGAIDLGTDPSAVKVSDVRDECASMAAEKSKVDDPKTDLALPTLRQWSDEQNFASCLLRADQWDVDMTAWPAETPLNGAGGTSDDIRSV